MIKLHDVEDTEQNLFSLDPKVKGQIMYFLVNASSNKLLDVAISNFAGAKVMIWSVLDNTVLRSYDVFLYILKPLNIATSNFTGA